MQMSIDVDIDQLLFLIRNLPEKQLVEIQTEISKTLQGKSSENKAEYLDMLLQAPTMSDEQYQQFKENRKAFNQWRTS
jgi:hypothetical protein